MANLSSITLPNNTTYNFKDNNAIPKNEDGNTQYLKRPTGLRGSNDLTLQGLFNATRANRLAFLPPDQIIIEKTIDGGTTWTDAEVSDNTKLGLFSETRNIINIPLIDGVRNPLCGIRVTFTAMKYNVPSGTVETAKYNYWNSDYVLSTERYNQIKQFYFWLSASDGSIGVKIEGAKGSSANSWQSLFNDTNYYMTGWSGSDYVRLNSQYVFGGGTHQTGNSFWNYRITFMSKGQNGTDNFDTGSKTQYQNITQIRAYGDSYWIKGNEYAATDKIYTHDYNKNVTFPARVNATSFNGYTIASNVPANAVFTDTTYSNMSQAEASAGTATTARSISAKVLHDTIEEFRTNPLGAYQATIGDGTSTTYTINHNLNNDFILVSVSITENNVTYMAPLASVASPNQIGYNLTITNSNTIVITFTSAPGVDAAKVSIVSTQAVAEAIDNLLLLTPDGEDYLKI